MNIMLQHSSTKNQSSKLPPFLETKRKILFKLGRAHHLNNMWVENFCEIAAFAFFAKIQKFKMAAIFGRNKVFEKWA